MSKGIDNRITALADALRRRQMEQALPVDPLSASLFSLERELAALDEQDKIELLEALNSPSEDGAACLDFDMEDLERWIKAFCSE